AYELFRESLQLQREIGNREGVIEVIEGSACVAARQGQVRRAVALAAAARTVRAEMAIPPDVGFQTELDSRVEAAAQSMSPGEAEAARASGSAMTLDEAASAAVDPSWQ
ncbi:MAG: hypothetical protein WBQ66_19080, partial [Blastocatellia bacterium]